MYKPSLSTKKYSMTLRGKDLLGVIASFIEKDAGIKLFSPGTEEELKERVKTIRRYRSKKARGRIIKQIVDLSGKREAKIHIVRGPYKVFFDTTEGLVYATKDQDEADLLIHRLFKAEKDPAALKKEIAAEAVKAAGRLFARLLLDARSKKWKNKLRGYKQWVKAENIDLSGEEIPKRYKEQLKFYERVLLHHLYRVYPVSGVREIIRTIINEIPETVFELK